MTLELADQILTKLSFHTDRCDVIAFLCLMPAKNGGENQVIDSQVIEKIIQLERPELHSILKQKYPLKRHSVDSANEKPYVMQPIFSECQVILHALIFVY